MSKLVLVRKNLLIFDKIYSMYQPVALKHGAISNYYLCSNMSMEARVERYDRSKWEVHIEILF